MVFLADVKSTNFKFGNLSVSNRIRGECLNSISINDDQFNGDLMIVIRRGRHGVGGVQCETLGLHSHFN